MGLTVNVMNYGAVGDGVHDDSAHINNAIEAVYTAGGGSVFFPVPPVNYQIASSINLAVNGFGCSNISLVGVQGWNSIIQCTSALNGSVETTNNDLIYGICNSYALSNLAIANGGSDYAVGDTLTLTSPVSQSSFQGFPASVAVEGAAGSTTWSYSVEAVFPAIGTATPTATSASASTSTGYATLSATDYNQISWSPVDGASSYNLFRTVSGGTPSTTGKVANIAAGTTTYNDQGAAGDGSTVPGLPTITVLTVSGGVITSIYVPLQYLYQMPFNVSGLASPPSTLGCTGGAGSGATFGASWKNGQQNVLIQDLVLDCSYQNNSGISPYTIAGYNLCAIELFNVDYATVYRCKIIRAFGNGVVFGSYTPSGAYPVNGCRIEECVFDTCVRGVLTQYQSSAGVNGVTGDCIQMGAAVNCFVAKNQVLHPGGPFLDLDLATGCIVENNYVGGYGGTPVGSSPYCTQLTAAGLSVSSGGSGYAVGDFIFLTGGTGTVYSPGFAVNPVLEVTGIATGGSVSGFSMYNGGCYSVPPIGTLTVAGTTGIGTGAMFSVGAIGVPSVANTGGTGTTKWSYQVEAVLTSGFSISSTGTTTTGVATLSGTQYNTVTWSSVSGASSYKVYRTFAGGTPGLNQDALGKIANTTGTAFNDNGTVAGDGTVPSPSTPYSQTVGTIHSDYGMALCTIKGNTFISTGGMLLLGNMGSPGGLYAGPTPGPNNCLIEGNLIYEPAYGQPLSRLNAPTVTGSGGTSHWSYQVVAISTAGIATTVTGTCVNGNLSLSASTPNTILWEGVSAASSYLIYRTALPTVGTPTPSTIGRIATVLGSVTSYQDVGNPGDNTQPPVIQPAIGASSGLGYANTSNEPVLVSISGGTGVKVGVVYGGNGGFQDPLAPIGYNSVDGHYYPTAVVLKPQDVVYLYWTTAPSWTWTLGPNLLTSGITIEGGSVAGTAGAADQNIIANNEIVGSGSSALTIVDMPHTEVRGNFLFNAGAGYSQADAISASAGTSGAGCHDNIFIGNQIFNSQNTMLSNYSDSTSLGINNAFLGNRLEAPFPGFGGFNSIVCPVLNYIAGNFGPGNPGSNPVSVNVAQPSVPGTGTPLTNPLPGDAFVSITGGSVSAVSIGPAGEQLSIALASGTFPLRYGEQITLTYSSLPTWKWWLR